MRRIAEIRRGLRPADGFTLIELLAAMVILAVGILSTFSLFDSSKRAISVSELQQIEIHRAQREIERLQSLPYARLFLTNTPTTSSNKNSPGFYVSAPAGSCPTPEVGPVPEFKWNQTESSTAEKLVISGCMYEYELGGTPETKSLLETGKKATRGEEGKPVAEGVPPDKTWTGEHGTSGELHDYITWVTDPKCSANEGGCPKTNDYKRITVEVTNNTSKASIAPTAPMLVSAIMVNPKALPIAGAPKEGNPLDSTEIKCKNSEGQEVNCSEGLGSQAANVWYLTNWPQERAEQYVAPSGANPCMHYTSAYIPTVCGASEANLEARCSLAKAVYTSCPQLDLLRQGAPEGTEPSDLSSPPLAFSSLGPKFGRTLLRDSNAKGSKPCSPAPHNDASTSEWWATEPLGKMKLTGNGGMTVDTATWGGEQKRVTLCIGVYLEYPVLDATCKQVLGPGGKAILDPLNVLESSCSKVQERGAASERDSQRIGTVSVTKAAWPGEVTPLSFTFSRMFKAQEIPAGTSIAVRIWPTAKFEPATPEELSSEDDVILQYDFKPPVSLAPSLLQINSE